MAIYDSFKKNINDYVDSLAYPNIEKEEPNYWQSTNRDEFTDASKARESLYKYGYPGATPETPMQKVESFITSDIPTYVKTGFQNLITPQQQSTALPSNIQNQQAPAQDTGSSFLKDAAKTVAYGLLGAGMGYGGASPGQIYGTFKAGKEAYELDNPESSTSKQYVNLVKNYSKLLGIPESQYIQPGMDMTARSLAAPVKELSDMYALREKEKLYRIGQGNQMNKADYNFARNKAFGIAQDISEAKDRYSSVINYMDTMDKILNRTVDGQKRTPGSFRRGEIGEAIGNIPGIGPSIRALVDISDVDVNTYRSARNQLAAAAARLYDKGALSNLDIMQKIESLPDASDPKAAEKLAEVKAMINDNLNKNLSNKLNEFNYLQDVTGVQIPIPEFKGDVSANKKKSGVFD